MKSNIELEKFCNTFMFKLKLIINVAVSQNKVTFTSFTSVTPATDKETAHSKYNFFQAINFLLQKTSQRIYSLTHFTFPKNFGMMNPLVLFMRSTYFKILSSLSPIFNGWLKTYRVRSQEIIQFLISTTIVLYSSNI